MMRISAPMRRPAGSRPAWTLTEILVVLTVIAVLIGLTFTFFSSALRSTDKLEADVAAAKHRDAAQSHAALSRKTTFAQHEKAPLPWLTIPDGDNTIPNQYLVVFKASVGDARTAAQTLATQYGGTVLNVYSRGAFRGAAIEAPNLTVAQLQTNESVLAVEKNQKMFALADEMPTGVRRITANRVTGENAFNVHRNSGSAGSNRNVNLRNGTSTSGTINVGVLDTGTDATHPDLNVVTTVAFGFSDVTDKHGHGTHCGGIIGAKANGAGIVGVYPGARLWSIKVLGADGSGTYAGIIDGLLYVLDHASELKIINMSLGGGRSEIVNAVVDQVAQAGVIVVVAAGNSSADAATFSPASASRAYTVAALADSDGLPGGRGPATSAGNDDSFATYSNYGSLVKLIAPGTDIKSTIPGGQYGVKSGTSMAAPHVAGMFAMLADPNTRVVGAQHRNVTFNLLRTSTSDLYNAMSRMGTEQIPGLFDSINYHLPTAFVQ